MQRAYILLTLRALLKNKVYSFINLAGLAIGIAAFLFIQLYVDVEKNFDRFHHYKTRIFRLQQDRYNQNELKNRTVAGCAAAGPSLKKNFPEVEHYVQLTRTFPVIQYNNLSFKEEHAAFASANFFIVFSFPLMAGIDSLVLKNPYSVVLSQSAAKRYFNNDDPIGKVLRYRGRMDLTVTGIFQDMPENSHMKFDILISFDTYFKQTQRVIRAVEEFPWRWDGFYTYVLLNEHADYKQLEEKFQLWIEKETGDWLGETKQNMTFKLQRLTDIHLQSHYDGELEANGNGANVSYLQLIAIFILVIAWINYISLSTAKSIERAKEVGIRKVLGSSHRQLLQQFLSESLLLNIAATFISILAIYISLPWFSELTERSIDLSVWKYKIGWLVPAIIITGALASGLYPAFVLASFKPALTLKGNYSGSSKGQVVRKVMVLVPFVAAITLLSCLYIIYQQIVFLRQQSLGFSIEQKLIVRDSEIYDSLYAARLSSFKKELNRLPGIEEMTYISGIPGDPLLNYSNGVVRIGADESEANAFKFIAVDENFINVLKLKLLAGKNVNPQDEKNKVVLVNEVAAKLLGFQNYEQAVNAKIYFRGDTVSISGVLNDFHHESPKTFIPPVIYVFDPDGGLFFMIPVQTSNAQSIVLSVQRLFSQIFPGQPFNYFFLDDRYNKQYQLDIQFGKVIGLFSSLLMVVAALGLFGLSAYTAAMRTREIGVRKVLGATETQLVALLSKEYIMIIAIATFIGVPVAWYAMNLWLNSFSKKVDITVFTFFVPVMIILIITLLTISFQTMKAALSNPVETLRNE